MKSTTKTISTTLFLVTMCICVVPKAYAHMMVAQHGTLNVVNEVAFMVLSVPVSAFEGIDDDGDGQLSMEEFTQHRIAMA